jgi:hypothetical protein
MDTKERKTGMISGGVRRQRPGARAGPNKAPGAPLSRRKTTQITDRSIQDPKLKI